MDLLKLYQHYVAGERDEIFEMLRPLVRLWAWDVMDRCACATKKAEFWHWFNDLRQEGACVMLFEIERRFSQDHIKDGKHLVNSLRKPVKKAMRFALLERFVLPSKTRRSPKEDDPVVLLPLRDLEKFYPKHKFSMVDAAGMHLETRAEEFEEGAELFYDSLEDQAGIYWHVVSELTEKAVQLSPRPQKKVLKAVLSGAANSVNDAAINYKISKSAAYNKLPRLAKQLKAWIEFTEMKIPKNFLKSRTLSRRKIQKAA